VLSDRSRQRSLSQRQAIVTAMLPTLSCQQIRDLVCRVADFVMEADTGRASPAFLRDIIGALVRCAREDPSLPICEAVDRIKPFVSDALGESEGTGCAPEVPEEERECLVLLADWQAQLNDEVVRQFTNAILPYLDLVWGIADPLERARRLAQLAKVDHDLVKRTGSPGIGLVRDALEAWKDIDCSGLDDDAQFDDCFYSRNEVLEQLAPHLWNEELAREAVDEAARYGVWQRPYDPLAILAPFLPASVAAETLDRLRELRHRIDSDSYDLHLQVLQGLATVIPDTSVLDGLLLNLEFYAQGMREEVIPTYVARARALDRELISDWWHTSTIEGMPLPRFLASLGRSSLLTDLADLAPLIARIASPDEIEQIYDVVERIGRWWP